MYWLRWHYHVKDIAGAPYTKHTLYHTTWSTTSYDLPNFTTQLTYKPTTHWPDPLSDLVLTVLPSFVTSFSAAMCSLKFGWALRRRKSVSVNGISGSSCAKVNKHCTCHCAILQWYCTDNTVLKWTTKWSVINITLCKSHQIYNWTVMQHAVLSPPQLAIVGPNPMAHTW